MTAFGSMTIELTLLASVLVLAIVQIMLTSMMRSRETGPAYNAGPRDEPGPPMGKITGRLDRARANLFETLPLFAAAILIAHVAGREGSLTFWGAWLYAVGRLIYVPLYAFAVTGLRSLVWIMSLFGLILVLIAILGPS